MAHSTLYLPGKWHLDVTTQYLVKSWGIAASTTDTPYFGGIAVSTTQFQARWRCGRTLAPCSAVSIDLLSRRPVVCSSESPPPPGCLADHTPGMGTSKTPEPPSPTDAFRSLRGFWYAATRATDQQRYPGSGYVGGKDQRGILVSVCAGDRSTEALRWLVIGLSPSYIRRVGDMN